MKAINYLCLFFALVCVNGFSQSVTQLVKYSGSKDDFGQGTVSDSEGNNYTIGTFQGTINFGNGVSITSNRSWIDLFLVKRDSTGQAIWAKSFGANDTSVGQASYIEDISDIAIDKSGDVYLLGEVNCSSTIIFGNITIPDNQTPIMKNVFVSKFDKNGDCKWVKINYTNPNAKPNEITVDENKNVTIVGGAYGGETFGTLTVPHSGNYIVTFDSLGVAKWAKAYYANVSDLAYGGDGKLYFTGQTSNTQFDNQTLTLNGSVDFFIAKADTNGSLIWVKNAGGGSQPNAGYAIAAHDTNIVILGKNGVPISLGTLSLSTSNKHFILSVDPQGNYNWVTPTNISGSWADYSTTDITVNSQKEIFFYTHSSGNVTFGNSNFNAGTVETMLCKLDSIGNPIWGFRSNSHGGNYATNTTGFSVDNYNHLYFSGYFKNTLSFYDSDTIVNSINGPYLYDVFAGILNTTDIISVGVNNISKNEQIGVYPNPSKDIVRIEGIKRGDEFTYMIMDAFGRNVEEGKVNSEKNNISLRNYSSGLYFFITSDGFCIKIIKE